MPEASWINAAVTVGVGAISGGVTNAIAVWMLFHPHEETGWGPFRLQGAIPKNKARLAKAIGKVVGEKLLTPVDLVERLRTPEVREAFAVALDRVLDDVLEQEHGAVGARLDVEARAAVDRALEDLAARLATAITDYIGSEGFRGLASSFTDGSLRSSLATAIRDTLQGAMQKLLIHERLLAKVVVRDSTVERIAEGIERHGVERIAAAVQTPAVRERVESALQKGLQHLLDRPVGRPAALLGAEGTAALRRSVHDTAWRWLEEQVPEVVGRLSIPAMVEEKVLGFSTERMEQIVKSVTEKELTLIVRLGYVLGALVGGLAWGVNQVM